MVGGSISGLLVASPLAGVAGDVTVLERDRLPADAVHRGGVLLRLTRPGASAGPVPPSAGVPAAPAAGEGPA